MKNSQNAGPPVQIPTNRQLTISLIGSIIRFAIDVPQVLQRRENPSPDKLFFLLLPIVRNLGKLIDRIRHSSSVSGRNASNGSGGFASTRGDRRCPHASNAAGTTNRLRADKGSAVPPPSASVAATSTDAMWQATQQVSSAPLILQRQRQQQQQQQCSMTSMLMSDEDDESNVGFAMQRGESPDLPGPRRQVLRQKDGNYAIRETTDTRGADGTFQRITKTISGPDVMILTNITSQLSELPTLMPKAIVRDSARPAEK